jgi:hypothetical protein
MVSKSSRKSVDQVLGVMSTRKAEQVLVDWANLPERVEQHRVEPHRQAIARPSDELGEWPTGLRPGEIRYNLPRYRTVVNDIKPHLRRLIRRYPEIFNPHGIEANPRIDGDPLFASAAGSNTPFQRQCEIAELVGELLRKAWDARTLDWTNKKKPVMVPDQRRRDWYLTDAESFYHTAQNRFGDPPSRVTPLEALVYYFRRNGDHALHCPNPDCPAPYFFATKKGQKYCSEKCAEPTQRAAKLRWWHENKNVVNRKKRRKAAGATRRRT